MITLVSILSFAAWVYLVAFRGRFWRSGPVLPACATSGRARVAVVVPARNEAESIRRSIGSLLAQDYPGELSILLVDDNSTDGTGEIAAALDSGERMKIFHGE